MKLHAYPGCYLIEPLESATPDTQVKLSTEEDKKKRILSGKVIDIGHKTVTKFGGEINPHYDIRVGDTVYFLSYEGNYDELTIGTKKYYVVLFEDCRAYEH